MNPQIKNITLIVMDEEKEPLCLTGMIKFLVRVVCRVVVRVVARVGVRVSLTRAFDETPAPSK